MTATNSFLVGCVGGMALSVSTAMWAHCGCNGFYRGDNIPSPMLDRTGCGPYAAIIFPGNGNGWTPPPEWGGFMARIVTHAPRSRPPYLKVRYYMKYYIKVVACLLLVGAAPLGAQEGAGGLGEHTSGNGAAR